MALAFEDYLLFLRLDLMSGTFLGLPLLYLRRILNWDFPFSAEDTFRFRAETGLC
ncbi:hypothetical protein C8F04DRAFT_1258061 [Mycena alexandri]|uniref:Uncharacterized protein n=1 Tax=Mycena alexandri TaxID=1745969 RepID=A0AAD6T1M2_9AGAR|nr:hypothetical protein C8F04DRAFT_1258061 [Mycena alexandri]